MINSSFAIIVGNSNGQNELYVSEKHSIAAEYNVSTSQARPRETARPRSSIRAISAGCLTAHFTTPARERSSMSRLLLAVGLCSTCAAYAPIGRPRPRRGLVVRRAEDRAEQIKKLNDMFYGTSTTTTDAADAASTDAASAAGDAADPLAGRLAFLPRGPTQDAARRGALHPIGFGFRRGAPRAPCWRA